MGNYFGWLTGTNVGRTDDPDPVTKLTSRDVYLIQNSWVPIRKQLTKVGVDLFMTLFGKYPQEKDHFPFRDIPNERLMNDKKFHAHCNRVMHNFDAIVDNINNVDLLVEILIKIGESHRKNQITPQSIWNVKDAALDLFKKTMNKETLNAWYGALDASFGVIVKNLQ